MKRFAVGLAADDAVARLAAAVTAYPMGLVAHINGQANAAKRGMTVPADQILEVFRPDFALRVWQAEKAAGIDIPLRIHVYAHEGRTWVAWRSAAEVFAPWGNPALDALAQELDPILEAVTASLAEFREN